MELLKGKVAIITGAGSGMGRACVELFAREGAKVVAADISGKQEETAAAVGKNALAVHCDVGVEADVQAMIGAALEKFGGLDAMLNVAGIVEAAMLADVDMEQYDRQMNVDLRGIFLGTKHAVRAMTEAGKGGAIINFASVGGINGSAFTGVYSAAKAGTISVTKTAAIECGPSGIRVNCICPGFIHTAMSAGAEQFDPSLPLKASLHRAGQPEEVAEVAAFLASDRASFVNGAIIPVDGGWSAKLA